MLQAWMLAKVFGSFNVLMLQKFPSCHAELVSASINLEILEQVQDDTGLSSE